MELPLLILNIYIGGIFYDSVIACDGIKKYVLSVLRLFIADL